ncbi:MAG: metallophosphoesterase [Actinomycetota bacterium]
MRTAIVSDLHLGTTSGADVARRPDVFERLAAALSEADRVVVLGDLLELRERPATEVLELAGPCLDALGQATAGKQVVLVPGNHDHQLVSPALDRARLNGERRLLAAASFDTSASELASRVAARMPDAAVELAYPGVWLRDDVYATHGHYLDLHLTVPRVECVVGSAIRRFAAAARRPTGADAYEAALAPLYAFAHSVVQGSPGATITRGNNLSRQVWSSSNPAGRRSFSGRALGSVAIPGAVAALNALGLGPFRADISAVELRRAGLRAMAEVMRELGVQARHLIFGHTHRAGPLPGDVEGWWLPGGTRLTNTGSWLYEEVFVGGDGPSNPYWPGRVAWLADDGAPELRDVLGDLDPAELQRTTETSG